MLEYRVTFQPGGEVIQAADCTTILEAATQARVSIPSSCGGEGACGKCKVRVLEGKFFAPPSLVISEQERADGWVLACEAMVQGDLIVQCQTQIEQPEILVGRVDVGFDTHTVLEIPDHQQFDIPDGLAERVQHELESQTPDVPLATALDLHLPPPSLEDNLDDLSRLYRGIRKQYPVQRLDLAFNRIHYLGRILRDADWRVTVTVGYREGIGQILDVQPAKPDVSENRPSCYGLAVDVGTTTVACHLVDLTTGRNVDLAGRLNSQQAYGDDVITRILHAAEHEQGMRTLQKAVVGDINQMIRTMAQRQQIHPHEIVAVSVAGNATMTHLLMGIDPTYIRQEPYVATANFIPVIEAERIGLDVHRNALIQCAPGVASYVGGDTTAGVLASGMTKQAELSLLIDIGTNGEIVLGNSEWLICCCCSCGPAFEGSGVRCGMHAARGAIQRVQMRLPHVDVETIGNAPPRGICGSGMIDLLAEMLDAGVLDRAGRFHTDRAPDRCREGDDGTEFVIAQGDRTGTPEIVLTQADVNTILRSKAAIYAGVSTLVDQMGVSWDDIAKVYVAGGFGNQLDIRKSIEIGLLPDRPLEQYAFIGNSSVAGAQQALFSSRAHQQTVEIAKQMTYLELSADNAFIEQFTAAMFLPHTDLGRFPSVKTLESRD